MRKYILLALASSLLWACGGEKTSEVLDFSDPVAITSTLEAIDEYKNKNELNDAELTALLKLAIDSTIQQKWQGKTITDYLKSVK